MGNEEGYIIMVSNSGDELPIWEEDGETPLKFKTRMEAETAAGIESTQFEYEGCKLRVEPISYWQ